MDRKPHMDAIGAASLVAFSLLLAFNQVVIKVVTAGLQPVFAAGLRSAIALGFLAVLFTLLGRPLGAPRRSWPGLALTACFFTVEFILLFVALDLTAVSRASIIFYSMPLWLSLGAHFLLEDERMTPSKAAGLGLALAGVAWAILDRSGTESRASLVGDLLALGAALCWAGVGLSLRATRASEAPSHVQLMAQLALSAVVMLALAPAFGPFLRQPTGVTWAGLAFQSVVVAGLGFLFWVTLLKIYPAASVASFSFLSPVFGVFLGWALLGEPLTPALFGALGCVAVGLILINWPRGRGVPAVRPPE